MLNESEIKKLRSYLGFVKASKSYYAGLKLLDMLKRNKIFLLVVTNKCSQKNFEKFKKLISKNTQVVKLNDDNLDKEFDIFEFNSLNAIGLTNENLAKAILSILSRQDTKGE